MIGLTLAVILIPERNAARVTEPVNPSREATVIVEETFVVPEAGAVTV